MKHFKIIKIYNTIGIIVYVFILINMVIFVAVICYLIMKKPFTILYLSVRLF
jgi:hypothetical protein